MAAKLRRRARRVERRVAHLPAVGEPHGAALLSFIVDPFLLPRGVAVSHDHTHDWESLEMGRALAEMGFAVDAIHWTHAGFAPRRPYDLFVDVRLNLERLAPRLPPGCLKVLHAETAHWRFHNQAQQRRLQALRERRGIELPPFRLIEENRAIEHADCATVLGNDFTAGTYAFAGKPLYRVPLSNPLLYPFPPAKDFAAARRRFLWFGSGGLLHKGLDLVLEAFAGMPELELVVCGPIARERPFESAFWGELYRTPNITTLGWVDVAGARFREIADGCVATVYPSCSEGGGGSTITCMHAGLIPVVTRETSVDLPEGGGVLLGEATVEEIRAVARQLAATPPGQLAAMARRAWEQVRRRHTRDTFAAEYRRVMREVLERHGTSGGREAR